MKVKSGPGSYRMWGNKKVSWEEDQELNRRAGVVDITQEFRALVKEAVKKRRLSQPPTDKEQE